MASTKGRRVTAAKVKAAVRGGSKQRKVSESKGKEKASFM